MTPPTNPDFFDDLKDWSERKLQLLEKYVDPAAKILGSIKQVYYVDAFAGAGIYADNEKGSPVRIAELAQRWEQERKPYALRCINIEENGKNFANLQKATSQFGNLVLNIQGSFVDNLDTVLRLLGARPAIFFLDPFGIKDIDWSAITKLINRKPPIDIWIRFDHSIVRRLDGLFETDKKMFEILARAYGIQDKAKLHSQLAGRTAQERIQNAVQLYKQRLADAFANAKGTGYAASYSIRSLSGQNKYFLIFATAHPKGITLASEVVYRVEEDYQQQLQEYKESQFYQLSLFPVDPTQEEIDRHKAERLKEAIWEAGKGKTLNRIQIYTAILSSWFGKITSKHLSEALKSLQQEGRILKIDGPPSQDTTRFTFRKSD